MSLRALIVFLTILVCLPTVLAGQSEKRSELIDIYTSNLDRIWQINDTFPPDIYLSSLGSILLSSHSTDSLLNAKLNMAGASILYTAAKVSLLMSAEAFRSQSDCNEVFSRYQKIKAPDPEGLCKGNEVEKGVCPGLNLACQKSIADYDNLFKNWTEHFNNIYKNSSNEGNIQVRNALPFFMGDFLNEVKKNCSGTEWAKKSAEDFTKSCQTVAESVKKNIYLKRPTPPPWVPINGNFSARSRDFYTGCKNTTPYPHLPLIFAFAGKDIKSMLCEDDLLQGIVVNPTSTLKRRPLLLTGTHLRADYWLQMAEEAYERAKISSPERQKLKLDLKTVYALSGKPICSSPISEDKTCLPFSQNFIEAIEKKKDLAPLDFSAINALGNAHNSKKNLSPSELQAIERLASEMERNRSSVNILKQDVQFLINHAGVQFSFSKEAEL